jgi:hypothetical protein
MPAVNGVGKPCAGEPHARIDGRELETEPRSGHGHGEEQPHGKPYGSNGSVTYSLINVTAPVPDPPTRREEHGYYSQWVSEVISPR